MPLQAWLFIRLLRLVTLIKKGVVSIKVYIEHLYYCLKSKIHKCDKKIKVYLFSYHFGNNLFQRETKKTKQGEKTTSLVT